jgi:maltose alpha-D-glucosyltransferase / alpha-amylase
VTGSDYSFLVEASAPTSPQTPPGPSWLQTAVFYQVYPQSFYDSNGDGIGDLPGITQKIDYIGSIGCNTIWLNPIFESPFGDAGYDVADFYKVAPRYGTNEDFKQLCAEAHQRGLRVCLDLVAGHTSVLSHWFQRSALDWPNQYSNWYIWTPAADNVPGSQPYPGQDRRPERYLPNFFHFQPALNYGYANPKAPWQLPTTDPACISVREELKSIMKFWLAAGADGFRVDLAASLIRNDPDHQAIAALWRYYRGWLDQEHREAVLISEWGNPAISVPSGFHIDFLLQFGEPAYAFLLGPKSRVEGSARRPPAFFEEAGGGDISAFLENYLKHYAATKSLGYISLPTGNHDMPRASQGRNEQELRTILAMLLTMPGVPCIYYGDEIGMKFLPESPNREGGLLDDIQRCGSRTPMQWSKEINAGFSTAPAEKLYLPIDPSDSRPDVATQENDPASLLNFTRALLKLRHEHPALANTADFQTLYAEKNQYPFVYLRTTKAEQIIVAINPAARAVTVDLGEVTSFRSVRSLLAQGAIFRERSLTMDPISFGVFAAE